MAKDFFGNEIKVGDEIGYMQLGYRQPSLGVIIKLTPLCVFIETKLGTGTLITVKQFHYQVFLNTNKFANKLEDE